MKITRRSDKGKGGHLLISVPANRVVEVEAALNFLEGKRQKRGSQVVIDLIIAAAKRNGWSWYPGEVAPAPSAAAAPHAHEPTAPPWGGSQVGKSES